MVIASSLPARTRRPRVIAGLGGATYGRTGADPEGLYADAPAELNLGKPYALGALYARYPWATLLGLLGLGWAGGYVTWLFIGRRR